MNKVFWPFFFLFILCSCATKPSLRVIKDVKNDMFAHNDDTRLFSLGRYSDINLKLFQYDQTLNIAIHCKKEEFDKAYQLSRNIYSENKKNFSYWNELSYCYQSQHKYSKALYYLGVAHSLARSKQDLTTSHLNHAIIFHKLNKLDKAHYYFHEALKFARGDVNAREKVEYNLALFFMNTNKEQLANKYITNLIKRYPLDLDLKSFKAYIFFKQNKLSESLGIISTLPKQYQNNEDIHLLKANIHLELSNFEQALISIKDAKSNCNYFCTKISNVQNEITIAFETYTQKIEQQEKDKENEILKNKSTRKLAGVK